MDEESLQFVILGRRVMTSLSQTLTESFVNKYCQEKREKNAYLLWSKNSIERLMISSSVMILLSSSATSPRSSFDPFEAGGKKSTDENPDS